jgi:transcriptional regulator with XRE-family HTH domain
MSKDLDKNFSLFSKRLKEERDRMKLSQKEVADLCGVSREIWGKYERNQSVPGGDVLFSFAAAGADMNYIMTGQRAHLITDENPGYTLRPDQKALLDNLEHCPKEDQDAIKRMALRCAESRTDKDEEQKKNNAI